MEQRTDVHRPSAIIPEDYQYVAFDYIGDDLGMVLARKAQREIVENHMRVTGGQWAHTNHAGTCHVCGATALYLIVYYHPKSNTYIRTGEDCATKIDMSHPDMNAFRRAIHEAREAQAGKKKAQLILSDKGLSAAWELYIAEAPAHADGCPAKGVDRFGDDNGAHHACTCDWSIRWDAFRAYEETTIRDIVGKLVKYGSISDKAAAFAASLLTKIGNRAAVAAQRAAEAAAAAPAPSGRVIITGRVLSLQERDKATYYYGDSETVTKVLIQALTGYKVWGNRFANVEKGDLVTFTATVKVSDKDPKFGFFSRAAKAFPVNPETGEVLPSEIYGYRIDPATGQSSKIEVTANPDPDLPVADMIAAQEVR